jgi:hypothetical protein
MIAGMGSLEQACHLVTTLMVATWTVWLKTGSSLY